jgi:N-acetylneuraminate synthase
VSTPIRVGRRRPPVYVIAEIGINHNGELDIAKRLIDAAVRRLRRGQVPEAHPRGVRAADQWDIERETPWGR